MPVISQCIHIDYYIIEVAIGSYVASNKRLLAATFFHVKHRKREPQGVHGQLEGCNRNLRPKAAVAKEVHGNMLLNSFRVAANSLLLVAKRSCQ